MRTGHWNRTECERSSDNACYFFSTNSRKRALQGVKKGHIFGPVFFFRVLSLLLTVSLIFVDKLVVVCRLEETELLPCTFDVMAVRVVITFGAGLWWCDSTYLRSKNEIKKKKNLIYFWNHSEFSNTLIVLGRNSTGVRLNVPRTERRKIYHVHNTVPPEWSKLCVNSACSSLWSLPILK